MTANIETINSWHYVEMAPISKLDEIMQSADSMDEVIYDDDKWETAQFGLAITPAGVTVQEPKIGEVELFHAYVGKHRDYGDIALLWSVRGPGEGPRQRPVFIFYSGTDDEADFLEDGSIPTADATFIEMTPTDEADIRGEAT